MKKEVKNKKIIIFDMDGTLSDPRCDIDKEMSRLLKKLLIVKKVAIMSGASFKQIKTQVISHLFNNNINFERLYIFPVSSGSFYKYSNNKKEWKNIYNNSISNKDKKRIYNLFPKIFKEINYQHPKKIYGDLIEDRFGGITFAGLGKDAPIKITKSWDPDQLKRISIQNKLKKYLPEFQINIAGRMSIDITPNKIDKSYGIDKIEKHLGFKKKEMLFIGDSFDMGNNDYPIVKTGVDYIEVSGPNETKKVIKKILEE